MKKIYLILSLAVLTLVQANAAVTFNDVIGEFTGSLKIGINDPQVGNVTILPGSSNGRITLVLPDFDFSGTNLGDIVVVDARMSSSGYVTVSNYPLYIGVLSTRASISSTASKSPLAANTAELTLTIKVPGLPDIPVVFEGTRVNKTTQMPNNSFEEAWKTVDQGVEPNSWHSFNSSTGQYSSMTHNNSQLVQGSARPGSTGSKSAVIKARNMVITIANGNLTNGQINGGSMTASDANGNYNFSDPSNTGFNTPFTAQPDSFVFWANYNGGGSNEARMHTVITTNARYQDPESGSYASVKVADAALNYGNTGGWVRKSVPFVYTSKDPTLAAYILTTFTTNKNPGQGSANDQVMIDDIELIYNHHLTSLSVGNEAINFNNGVGSINKVFNDSTLTITAQKEGKGAQAVIGYDKTNSRALVYVVGADYANNKAAYEMYTVNFTGTATDLSDASAEAEPAKKVIMGGQVLILRDGVYYDLLGNRVR